MNAAPKRARHALAALLLFALAGCGALRPDAASVDPESVVDEIWRDPSETDRALRSGLPTPELRQIAASMDARMAWLRPWLDLGVVGLDPDGYLRLIDADRVPDDQRNAVRDWVAEDNADRVALYQASAAADALGRSEAEFKQRFNEVWQRRAAPAWRANREVDTPSDR